MTYDRFIEIMDDIDNDELWKGDNTLQGANLMHKYLSGKTILHGADHDVVYGPDIVPLLAAGITEEDVIALRKWNWTADEGYMKCYV